MNLHYINPNTLYKKTVKELDLTIIKPPRAGIILYTKYKNEHYFGLGIDTNSKEITDFGGGISYKERDKDVISGALREFKEETLGILDLNYQDVIDDIVLYDGHNLIIFKYIDTDPFAIQKLFRETYDNQINSFKVPEVSDMIWMNANEFKYAIMSRHSHIKMFFRVQTFLQKAGNFYWLLC